MLLVDFFEFKKALNDKRILSLDVSKKRIGVAVSDHTKSMALPIKVIIRLKFLQDIERIKQLYTSYSCGGIVIGYPLLSDGTKGKRCQSISDFTKLLLKTFNIPVTFIDESYSTTAAINNRHEQNIKSAKDLDHIAASYFLQSFLSMVF